MNYLDTLAYLKIDFTPTFDNKILVLQCREDKMTESLCEDMERNDRQVEREKGEREAKLRSFLVLGVSGSCWAGFGRELSERKRESASEMVKKRTRDEKRGNKRTRRVGDDDEGGRRRQ